MRDASALAGNSPLHNTRPRFGIPASLAFLASLVCLQAATATTSKGLHELHPVESSQDINSARKLRLRSFILEPGGLVELHGHKDHPSVLHVIKGTLTTHPEGFVLRAGVGLTEDKNSNFWIQNIGSEPAEFIWLPVFESSSP